MTNLELAGAMVDLARRRFYYYCRFRLPQVYTAKRPHLERLCDALQEFYESDRQRLILNLPPRHGKTLTVELLTEWILGRAPNTGVMVACYNETLSSRFSKAVRGGISEKPVKIEKPVFSDYFPGVTIKDGDGAMQLWALEGSHFSFLATSPGGTMTGIGAQLLVIDDLIKNAQEANNERILEEHQEWYSNTVLSRLEAGAKQIVIQTRWAKKDLSGWLMAREGDKWQKIVMPAQNEDGTMLCDDILTAAEFEDRKKKTDPIIIAGNYQQAPYDSSEALYRFTEGNLYRPSELPRFGRRMAYIDTADQGMDFLAGGCWLEHDGKAYILDLIYTQEAMERTEPDTAAMLQRNRVERAYIESNNGGRGFARNVQALLVKNGFTSCGVEWFHQGANKWSRITANANSVVNCVVFPHDWRDRWPLFALHVERASRASQPKPDDAHDFLTGVVETLQGSAALIITEQDRASLASRWRK